MRTRGSEGIKSMQYLGNAVTDIGTVKRVNQDSLTLKIAESSWGMVCLAVICDGLGGLEQGEVASASVVMEFARWFQEIFPKKEEEWTEHQVRADWEALLFSVNSRIIEHGRRNQVQIGTTVTAVLFFRERYYMMHVGDCRLYEISEEVRQLTKDQTVVANEVECGRMTPEQAAVDSRRNVLLQCVGVNENLKPVFQTGIVKPGCAYLLCSDGFRHEINEQELLDFCCPEQNGTGQDILRNLSHLAGLNMERGERDNLSAILIRTDEQLCWK